jgi:hypothetical protein
MSIISDQETMKIQKQFLYIILLLHIPILLFAQTSGERKQKLELQFDDSKIDINVLDSLSDHADPFDIFLFLNKVEFSVKDTYYKSISQYLQEIGDIDVLLFFNGVIDRNQHCLIDMRTLTKVKYIEEGRSLAVLWLEDNSEDIYQTEVKIIKSETGIIEDGTIIAGIFSDLFQANTGFGLASSEKSRRYYIESEYLQTPVPSELFVKIKQISKTRNSDSLFKHGDFDNIISINSDEVYFYKVHEMRIRNYSQDIFGLALGASIISIKPSLITADENDLIKVQKNNKSELKGSAHLLGYIQFPRSKAWEPGYIFWESSFYNQFYKRFSLQAGLSISDRPLDNLFVGIGFSVLKHIDIIFGAAFVNDLKEAETDLSIKSFEDLDKLLPKRYTSNFFIDLSFRASAFK